MKVLYAGLFVAFISCAPSRHSMHTSDQNLYQHAVALSHRHILVDGHVDLPYQLKVKNFRLEKEFLGIPVSTDKGDFDYERAKQGGLSAPFMAVFVPAFYQKDLTEAKLYADSIIEMMDGIIVAHPDKFGHGRNPKEIEQNFEDGLISLPYGMENGVPLETLKDVDYYFAKGIRYVTLTHAKDNHISDSSYDTARTWNGLSPYGVTLIEKMNATGMIIDVSHVSDDAFYQVMKLSKVPVLATHSSCRKFTPGWERNMDDDMIRLLAENQGVIMINFGSTFLDATIAKNRDTYKTELVAHLAKKKLTEDDPEAKEEIQKFSKRYPDVYSDVKKVADHIDHVREIAGIDFVGIGSDFDGVGDSLPAGLKDVSMYPNLVYELLKRGYTEEDIAKIWYKNVWRVWHEVNRYAGRS